RPRYSSTGHLLYGDAQGNLVASSFDAESSTIRGNPTVLAEGLLEIPDGGWAFDISGEGTLVYTLGHDYEAPARSVVLANRAGTTERVPLEVGQWEEAKLSPDANSLALRRRGFPDCSLWIFDRRRELLTRVPIDGDAHELSWSPDGKSLVFTLDQRVRPRICRFPTDGSGPLEELSHDELNYREGAPLGDGRRYVCSVRTASANHDIVLLDGQSGTSRPLIETPALEFNPAVSPDGRWLAYSSNESDRDRSEVYVRPFPDTGRRVQVSSAGGFLPRWSRDGRELYYVEEGRLMWVGIDTDPALEVSAPAPVFPGSSGRWTRIGYDVTPDPTSFLVIEGDVPRTVSTLHVVLGWPQVLERATSR
ncbi:MAG: hypothetical protein L0206_11215, partial [Actinobacteria bacterium]|nr:hypothetical protein [Actinomycetota bacterium]